MTCLTEKGLFKNADGVHPFPFHGAGVKPGDVATLHGGVKADFRLSLLEKLTPGEEEEIALSSRHMGFSIVARSF